MMKRKMTAFITTTDEEQQQARDEQQVSSRPVCWDEKVRARITPEEQYLYDFPFFAEMFNAMDAHYKQVDGCKWRLVDFRSHEDVEEIYGTSDTRALEGHFRRRRYQVPLVGSGQRVVKHVECMQSYIRVVLFEEQYFKLQVLAKMLDRSAEAYNRTLRASPFDGILGTQLWNTLQQQRRNMQQQEQHSPVPAPILYTNALLDDAIEDQEKDEMIRFARTEVYERPRPRHPPPFLSDVRQGPPRERPGYKPVTRPLQSVLTYDSDLQRALEESLKTGRTHLAMQDQNQEIRTWIDDDEKGYVSPGDSSLAEQQREKSRRGAADDPDSARPDDRFFRPYENRPPLLPMAGASVIRERKPVTDLFGELTPSTKYLQPQQHQSPAEEEEEEEMDEDLRRAIEESLRFDPTSERRDVEEKEGDDERESTTSTTSTTTIVHDTVKKPVLHSWKPPRGLLNPPRGLPPGSAFKLPAPPPNTVPSLAHHFDQTDDEECQRAIEASLIAEQQRQSREKRLSESRKEREQQQQDDRPVNIWEYIERRREKSERIVEDPSLLPDVIAEMRLEDEVLADSSLDQGGDDDDDPLDQCFDELHPEEREWMLKALFESKHETGPSDTVLLPSPPTIAGDGDDPAASSWSSDNSAEEMGQRRTTQRKLVDSRDFKSRMSDLDAFHEQLKADAAKLNEQRVAKHNYKYNKTTSLSIVTHEVFTGILNHCTLFALLRMVCVSRSLAERVDRLLALYPPRSICVESVCQLRQAIDGKWATLEKNTTTARSILRHIRSSIATIRFQLSQCVRRNISYAWYPPPSDVEFKKLHDDRQLYADRDTAVSFKSVLVCLQTYDDLDILPHVLLTAQPLDVFIYVDKRTLSPNCAERFEALMAQQEREGRIRLFTGMPSLPYDEYYVTIPVVIDDPGYRLWDSLDNGCH